MSIKYGKPKKYDYSKLKQESMLTIIDKYFRTREMDIMIGQQLVTIRLGNGLMFIIEDGELRYYGGLSRMSAERVSALAHVMEKMQSVITLECPVFE